MIPESVTLKVLIVGCLAALLLACFHRAILDDQQFAYRDAAHYYYPLYERVQHEWNEGRWPLWEPEENAGMPLMGNPTAAVLYPGKIIYAVFPYPTAARLYILAHVVLAFGAMLAMMRGLGVSWTGAGLSSLAYTFCAPILFQYCNVIYLVGAAWLPLGFLAVDRWIRLGSSRALVGLAVVLAMQTLGGDPQSAYLLGLCSLGYAAAVSWTNGRGFVERTAEPKPQTGASGRSRLRLALIAMAVVWVAATWLIAWLAPRMRPHYLPPSPTPALWWMLWAPRVVPIVWGLAMAFYFTRKSAGTSRRVLLRLLMGLGGAAVLAGALTAAQLLPVVEFTQQTVRAAEEGPHEIYPFSIEPFRTVELFCPGAFGTSFPVNASWLDLIQLSEEPGKVWTPSLYVGGAVFWLAASALAFRGGGASRVWLSWIVAITLLGSFGEYTSPIWAVRFASKTLGLGEPFLGGLDPVNTTPLRKDGFLRDGDGGLYWAMTTFLPAFRQFRFPSKLMTFTVLGVAALAGYGWDDLMRGKRRRAARMAAVSAGCALVLALVMLLVRGPLMRTFDAANLASAFGPFNSAAAYRETFTGLLQSACAAGALIGIIALVGKRPALAGAAVLLGTTVDLAVANRALIATVPQAFFETNPEVLKIIQEAEKQRPSDGPFRIHRSPIWNPPGWVTSPSPDRVRDFMEWERDTLQPKYGINLGVDYTHTLGVAELYDYEWFFAGFPFSTSPEFARSLNIAPGSKVVYFPRRSFDMWNSRYFVLPAYSNDWMDENRGYAAFLFDTEIVHPPPELQETPEAVARARAWVETKDYQIRRNRRQYPRAWVVHSKVDLRPISGLSRDARSGPMMEIMYDDQDPIWRDSTRRALNPREVAWVEAADALALAPFSRNAFPKASEKVQVSYPSSTRAELTVTLETPGIVVLADVYYPGWKLTIDGEPAPVYRVNRMMRGAAVEAGRHTLVYTYEPRSFRLGLIVTGVALAATLGLAAVTLRRPRSPLPWNASA